MRLANRTTELDLFKQMVQQQCRERILLIEAPSGYGKSDLLACFAAHCPDHRKLVQLDLKDATFGIAYLIARLQRKLGRDRFPTFERAVREFLLSGVEVTDTEIVGQENIFQVVLNDTDENQRNFRFSRLQDAFLQDIANFKQPTVLLLDTFNAASKELQAWLRGQFLSEMAELENFVVVIAGQYIPEVSIEWRQYHHCCRLGAIEEEAWCQYIQEMRRPLNRIQVETVVRLMKVPADIVKAFETLERGQRS